MKRSFGQGQDNPLGGNYQQMRQHHHQPYPYGYDRRESMEFPQEAPYKRHKLLDPLQNNEVPAATDGTQ